MPKTKEIATAPTAEEASSGLIARRVKNNPVGLEISPETTFEEWTEIYHIYSTLREQSRWMIGDCLNFAEKHFPDKYAQAIDTTGRSYSRLTSYASVCARIEVARRRANLSFDHHESVAFIPAQEADKILDRAEKLDWTRDDVRDAVCIVNGLPTKAEREQQKKLAPKKPTAARGGKIIEVESTTTNLSGMQTVKQPDTDAATAGVDRPETATLKVRLLPAQNTTSEPSTPAGISKEGWTGEKCPRCKGYGEVMNEAKTFEIACPSCAGTGEEYASPATAAPAMPEPDASAALGAFVATIQSIDVPNMKPLQIKAWLHKLKAVDDLIEALIKRQDELKLK